MRIKIALLLGTLAFASHAFSQTTILTYNIANYNDHPDWSTRLGLIVDAIEKAHADVVILQEVRFDPDEASSKSSYQNAAEQILHELNARGDFMRATLVTQPIMYYPLTGYNTHNYVSPASMSPDNKSYKWEGLSIISKPTVLETGSVFLSDGCNDFNKRATQYVKLMSNGKPLYIVNVHFGLTNGCLYRNVNETLKYISKFDQTADIVMAGDMNAQPDNPALKALTNDGFIDSWQLLHPTELGFTFPSNAPSERIDYIWLKTLTATTPTSAQMTILASQGENGVLPSDHLGLALTLPED